MIFTPGLATSTPPESQVHHHRLGRNSNVLGQDGHLLQLLGQRVTVIGIVDELDSHVQRPVLAGSCLLLAAVQIRH